MNVNRKIKDALAPFGFPVHPDMYTGAEDSYFVFTYADERISAFADNQPVAEEVEMYIHLYLPVRTNYMSLKKKVSLALYNVGFTYPSIDQMIDKEANKRHLIFDCKISGHYEMEE